MNRTTGHGRTARLTGTIALVVAGLAGACSPDAPTSSAATAMVAAGHVHEAGVGAAQAAPGSGPVFAEIRASTARYHRFDLAVADGFVPLSPCVVGPPGAGAMGFHYGNPALIDGTVDPSNPEILLYVPQKNGRMRLVAVEFMVAAAPWDATHSSAPTLAGATFDDHRDPATRHGIPFAHYDLHAWVWHHNPAGMHAPFNAQVSCS